MSDDPDTVTMRAVKVGQRLDAWKKIALAIPVLVVAAYGVMGAGEALWGVIVGFGPLETQFRNHVGDFDDHVDAFQGHVEAHDGEHNHLDSLGDTLLGAMENLRVQNDTVLTRQAWLWCLQGQERDVAEGRPLRDCEPLGGFD